ncbi:hypothetical protein MCP1_180037 [Candidatus Terasakiella magnetica]|nr:hypothetical protein MCP1_180037 [Candidatus Terasakiella magnetica]
MAAGASMTRRSMPLGGDATSLDQSRPIIGGRDSGRRRSQLRLERWRSQSPMAVFRPVAAKAAAMWVASVVLPQPPLILPTSTVFMPVPPPWHFLGTSIARFAAFGSYVPIGFPGLELRGEVNTVTFVLCRSWGSDHFNHDHPRRYEAGRVAVRPSVP